MDFTPYLGGGGVVALLSLSIYLIIKVTTNTDKAIKTQAELIIQPMRNEIKSLKEDNLRCNRRVAILTNAISKAGIPIPDEFWKV